MNKIVKVFFVLLLLVLIVSCDYGISVFDGSLTLNKTTHPRESFFVADFSVEAVDEVTDMTTLIQNALNECSSAGGGTVYLPSGKYRITGSINIPSYVTLCGDFSSNKRTIILADVEEKDSITEGLFNIGGSAGVFGLTVYYPNQDLNNVKKYPFTFYTDGMGSHYMMQSIKNCTVINGYRGIGACGEKLTSQVHEMLMVENFSGTFLLEGFEVYNQADVGIIQNVNISANYWAEYTNMNIVDTSALKSYMREHTTGLVLSAMDWPQCDSICVKDCKIGIRIPKGPRVNYSGVFSRLNLYDCELGMIVKSLDIAWGINIFDSNIGRIKNTSGGIVQLSNVECIQDVGSFEECGNPLSISYYEELENTETFNITNFVSPVLDRTGLTDCSSSLQAVLNSAEKGSIVYVKSGNYRFDNPITIPEGVELRGFSPVAQRDNYGEYGGTYFLCYYGDGENYSSSDTAFITMKKDSGLCSIKVLYPKNMPKDSNLNTTYAIRGNGSGLYLLNCSISGAYLGVDFRDCDNHFIKQVCCCCYRNTFLLGGENGTITDCLQNGTVLLRSSNPFIENNITESIAIFEELFNPILRKYCDYLVFDNAKNETVFNVFVYGASRFMVCQNNSTINALNVGSDNTGDSMFTVANSNLSAVNIMRFNGVSYKIENGSIMLWNRLSHENGSEGDVRF